MSGIRLLPVSGGRNPGIKPCRQSVHEALDDLMARLQRLGSNPEDEIHIIEHVRQLCPLQTFRKWLK